MDEKNRNLIIAITLSVMVLIIWQALFIEPQRRASEEAARRAAQQQTERQESGVQQPRTGEGVQSTAPGLPLTASSTSTRGAALAMSERVSIDTPSLSGSVNLRGGRIDDLTLKLFRTSVDKTSDPVTLLSPSGSPSPNRAFYAEHGWVAPEGSNLNVPGSQTEWTRTGSGPLTPTNPLVLTYDNGQGLVFTRRIEIDEHYMFSITQRVENRSSSPVTLYPYGLISRHGVPQTQGFFILHEGPIGVLGESGLEEFSYSGLQDEAQPVSYNATGGWLGITDKYWAAVLVPDQSRPYQARFDGTGQAADARFQTDFLLSGLTVPAGGNSEIISRLFAGAKQTELVDGYEANLGIDRFELLIDWGWFHFITKPLFYALEFFYKLVGNFGVSILIVTVLIKLVFFPLANKSYESMSKMKKLQPELMRMRERFKDDKMRQQQEMMALYKREKVNPLSGCLPILIQIPVFFALYKVLFVTIEMRHAPFIGWIQDLSAIDPTNIFNLFGLIPVEMPLFLHVGIWPILMGITMFVQMRLNPMPPDPIQQMVFNWMPLFFTYLLASFPAGLVIYWTWNNLLTIAQQWYIMNRQGVNVNLLENMGLQKLVARISARGSGKG